MKQQLLTVTENKPLNETVYRLRLGGGDFSEIRSGQFLEISVDGFFLRRPFGVSDFSESSLTVFYKTVGRGTEAMTGLAVGTQLDVLTGLGNGFDLHGVDVPLLIGGGIGAAPLLSLAREFEHYGAPAKILLCAKTESELFAVEDFNDVGRVRIATDDGSRGFHGNAVQWLEENKPYYSHYYACGPMPMLKSLAKVSDRGFLSLEARMGCGFGACMGCTIKTVNGPKRVCKDGPVFPASEVIFDD